MKNLKAMLMFFAAVGGGGCFYPSGTYTIRTRDVRQAISCAAGPGFTVASLTLHNSTLDTVALTVPPVTGLTVSELDAIPPRTEGMVFFSVRCPVGRSFSVDVLATTEPEGSQVVRPAKRRWSFNDNFRSVRHDTWVIERERNTLRLR